MNIHLVLLSMSDENTRGWIFKWWLIAEGANGLCNNSYQAEQLVTGKSVSTIHADEQSHVQSFHKAASSSRQTQSAGMYALDKS